jgi:hypothetical protein
MSEDTDSEIGKFALPFAVLSEKRNKPFTSDMEMAAVFSIAELNRKKPRRIILRRTKENIAFISKIGYPLWTFPFAKNTLIFDGLNFSHYSMPYTQIPNAKTLLDNLKTSSKTNETYTAFLAEHAVYFDKTIREKSLPLKNLISDIEFLNEIGTYRQEATKIDKQPENLGPLSHQIDESRLNHITHEMATLRSAFEKDLKTLSITAQLLAKTTQNFLKKLHDQVKAVKEEFAQKIDEEEAIVTPKVNTLREQYDKEIITLAKNIENQQLPLHKEKLKLERQKEETNEKITQLNIESQAVAKSDDIVDRQQWKQEIKDTKTELAKIEDQIKDKENAIGTLEKKRLSESLRLKSKLETGIREARKNIVELEASRDAKILIIRQEIEKLEKQSKQVSDQIGVTTKQRENEIAQFEKLQIKPASEELNKALIYIPFYVVSYSSGTNNRYIVIPPSMVGNIGISTKLKGALGRARVKSFLTPRFKRITQLADLIHEQCDTNNTFEMEIKELGIKNNNLSKNAAKEEMEKGLLNLKNQGWLSDKDYGAIASSAKTNLNATT